jgi:hypothetical protein
MSVQDSTAQVEALISELEQQMPDLQLRHGDVFALANAWAERYAANIAATSRDMLAAGAARLSRIGIRWGVMPGARVTREFRALGNLAPRSERLQVSSPGGAPHDPATNAAVTSGLQSPTRSPAVTTSSQQSVLSAGELACLLDCARGTPVIDHVAAQALVAKGMLEDADGKHVLTPAGHHALHVDQPGMVPGIDS